MAVDIPDSLTDLASDINVTAVTPRRMSRARNQKTYSDLSPYGRFNVEMNFSLLTDDQADQLAALVEYANSLGEPVSLRLGVRSRSDTGALPLKTTVTTGSTQMTVTGVTPGSLAEKPGKLFKFDGHSKIYRIATSSPANGLGESAIDFSPPIRQNESGSVQFNNITFTAWPQDELEDVWSGGQGRANRLSLEEYL